jgi:polysaccharide export outer membrane protein
MVLMHRRIMTALGLLSCAAALGQVKESVPAREKNLELQQSVVTPTKEDLTARISGVPLEGPVHPDHYVVGPSDVFQVGLWGPFSVSYPVTVTPEGTIIIPTVGEISVAGIKLAEAKSRVLQKVRTKYLSGDVTFTLLRPRSIVVTLRGSVLRQGQYVVSSVDRVEKLLSLGANVESPQTAQGLELTAQSSAAGLKAENLKPRGAAQAEEIYNQASTRNIVVMRKNGDTVKVDIPRFYATGEDQYNPFLLDGDVVQVPPRQLSRNSVGVYGAVNSPGTYEWVEGDSVLSLVQIAQGALKGSDLEHVKIQRVNDLGQLAEELAVNLLNVRAGSEPNVPLERGDRIVVPLVPDNRGVYSITIGGEVNRPGMYPIIHGRTRLTEILAIAGGFKDDALLSGALILRRDDQGQDLLGPQISMLRNVRSQQLAVGDSAYFYMDVRVSYHPVVVDFAKLVQDRDSTQDVVLRHEDVIYVPANNQTVLVHGQVQKPGYLPFVPGMKYKYYIEQAGGYSELATTGDTKVIKKATLEWLDPSDTVIEPGDQIWVPKDPIRELSQSLAPWRDIITVIASIATTVLVAVQVLRN